MSKTDTYINKHTKAHIDTDTQKPDAQAYTKEEKKNQERKKNIGERH